MPRSTWLMAIWGLFLAATLIWAVPVCAQSQSGGSLKSYQQGSGTGSGNGAGYGGTIKKSQESPGDKFGWKNPGQVEKQGSSHNNTLTPAKSHNEPQSQTPGGTIIQ